jgi:peptide/nickel transport system ATP-binding protein
MSTDAPTLLSVRDLRVTFPTARGPLEAVNGVSFDLAAGEVLGVVGESGSGKSVTALSLMRLLPSTATASGTVAFNGVDVLGMPASELQRLRGKHVSMVFQDPMTSLNPVRTIGAQMEETLRAHLGMSARAARDRAAALLEEVGIPAARRQLDVYPHEMSGGMRQRVMIAIALSCEPQLVLADEPTTALDVSVQAQILELLRSVTEQHGTALIMITHDLSVVAGLADRVAVMYAGEIVELAPSEELFAYPRHPYTSSLLECVTRVDEVRGERLPAIPGAPPDLTQRSEACAFAPRCRYAQRGCTERPPLLEKAPGQWAACFEEIPAPAPRAIVAAGNGAPTAGVATVAPPAPSAAPAPDADVVLDVRDLEVHFRQGGLRVRAGGPGRAVDGISFEVRRGETLGLVGESGSGKSTAARALLGLVPPTGGEVRLFGDRISGRKERDLKAVKRELQMVLQDPYSSLDPRMTVEQLVAEPLIVHGLARGQAASARAAELLETVGLPAYFGERAPNELSGGQRQRVNIARAMALGPACIVADEPTSALDVSVRAQILNLLQDLQDEQRLTYLFISHDLGVVRHMSDHVAVMYLGRLVEIGDRETIFRAPHHPYTRGLLSVVPVPDPKVERKRRRVALTGEIPNPANPPEGCNFNTRCPFAFERCFREDPALRRVGATQLSACFLADGDAPSPEPALPVSSTTSEPAVAPAPPRSQA